MQAAKRIKMRHLPAVHRFKRYGRESGRGKFLWALKWAWQHFFWINR